MINRTSILLVFGILAVLAAQCTSSGDNQSPDTFIETFTRLAASGPEKASAMADSLSANMSIPYIAGDEVLLLYKSDGSTVDWRGDFNQWGSDGKMLQGRLVADTGWWFAVTRFPLDARLDYKIVVDDSLWVTDPSNPLQQLGGAGFNSVIKMPGWKDHSVESPADNRGSTSEQKIFNSNAVSAEQTYQIHYTTGFNTNNPYGVLVVTDGHEYNHSEMGNLSSQADYLSTVSESLPLAIILLDPRDPKTGENHRAGYFTRDTGYLEFVGSELPQKYPDLFQNAEKTAILGTSFGGFFATQLSRLYPDIYQHAIIQSPAYWPKREIIDAWKDVEPDADRRFVITYGTFFDGGEDASRFTDIMEDRYPHILRIVVNEGHSWGAWRNQLPIAIRFVFGG